IVCIGYDVYPGAKMTEIVRDVMLMHAHNSGNVEQLERQAEAALYLFDEGIAEANPQAPTLSAVAKCVAAQLKHEGGSTLLGRHSTPRYFIEFASQAVQAGLDYVGDSDAIRDLPERWGNNVQLRSEERRVG